MLSGIKYYHCHYDCILCVVAKTKLSNFENFFNPLFVNRILDTRIFCNNVIYYYQIIHLIGINSKIWFITVL